MQGAVIFFVILPIFLQAQEYKIDIKSPSDKLSAHRTRVRRYSTDGLFGAQAQNVSSEQPENIATQNHRVVNYSSTGTSPRKTTIIPAMTLNKFSPRCEFRKDSHGPIILPVIFEPTLQLVIDTISYKDNKEIFFKLMHQQSLDAIITLYNFCYAYQISTDFNNAIMNALLHDERFLKEITENPEGNILKNKSQMFAWQDETEATHFLSRYYMRYAVGEPLYVEDQEISLHARVEKIYWTNDCSQGMVIAGKNLRIFKLIETKYQEMQTISLLDSVQKITWSADGRRFIVRHGAGNQQLYELNEGCFRRSSVELPTAKIGQHYYWNKTLEFCIRKTPHDIYYDQYLKTGSESQSIANSKAKIEKIYCDESLTHFMTFDDLTGIKLYKKNERDIFKPILAQCHDGFAVNTLFVSPDSLTCIVSVQELNCMHTFVCVYPYARTTLPLEDNLTIKQICWAEDKKFIALLINNYVIQKYKYDDEGGYREVAVIDCSSALETEIISIFANQDISKIIALNKNNTLSVHQHIMTPEGLMYRKTQELRFQKQIQQIHCSKNLNRLVIRFENDIIEIMSCKNQDTLSVNQLLFFPALQKCNKTTSGRAYIENNKKIILDRIHAYQDMYGDWLVNAWSNVRIGCMSTTYSFIKKHSKICALLGIMAVVVPLSFIAGKYLTH